MHPIQITSVSAEELATLDALYRTTRAVRRRTRVQMVLLAAAADFFARYNQHPEAIRSIIGAHPAEVV